MEKIKKETKNAKFGKWGVFYFFGGVVAHIIVPENLNWKSEIISAHDLVNKSRQGQHKQSIQTMTTSRPKG